MPVTAMDLVAAAKRQIHEVSPEEASALVGKARVLDLREPAEYPAGMLPGAVNIPRGVLVFQIGNHPAFADAQKQEILVYCLSGGRSALAVETLQKLGYDKAVSLAGGFKAWSEASRPVEA